MEGLYPWVVLLHVIAAFTFALAHGVSAGVALKLAASARSRACRRCSTFSRFAVNPMYASVLVLLDRWCRCGFIAGLWGKGWIWAAIVLLVLMFVAMYARASTVDRRCAARRRSGVLRDGEGSAACGAARRAMLATLTASSRPMEIAAIGYVGLVLILWLMVMKPF
jgi:hypothetical protein